MATRNRNGRNLVGGGSAVATKRSEVIAIARAKNVCTPVMLSLITSCSSVKQLEILVRGHKLDR